MIELATENEEPANVILRNVAELAQRQQTRELGASLALQIFRLLKIAQFHALDNMAFLQQLDQTVEALKGFGIQTGEPLTLLFAKSTVFVCGQLLKASRAEYESALELSEMVRRLGVSQVTIQTDADRSDLTALARLFQSSSRVKAEHGVIEASARVRLRYVSAARLDENEQDLTPEEQILRTYATTVVVMRRVYENLIAGRYQLPNQAKRLAQRLVMLSEGDTPAFLGVTAMRTLNHDNAGRAVNRAILAVTMGRQLTSDLATLSRIAMSALFYDVATPLVTGIVGLGDQVVVPQMTDDAERRLPAATALVLTALGQLRNASMVRTVIAYEAHWLRQLDGLGPIYGGTRRPMVAARIVATAQRFNQLMETDLAASHTPTVDDAISTLRAEAHDAVDHAMILLLLGALGVFPRGTPVELSTGERGVVLRTPENPADYSRPTVRLVTDAAGGALRMKVSIDLAHDPVRQVVSVVANPDAVLLQAVHSVEQTKATQVPPATVTEPPSDRFDDEQPPRSDGAQRSAETVKPGGLSADPAPTVRPGMSGARASGEMVAQSVPQSTPLIRISARPSAIQEVPAPPSGRPDPRSEESPAAPLVASAASHAPQADGRLSRRPDSVSPPDRVFDDMMPDIQEISEVEPSAPSSHWRRPPATLPPQESPARRGFAEQSHAPSAAGSLERTPFSHVLLYILDRALSGTLILTEPSDRDEDDPVEHAVYFQDGIPTKVHTGSRVAPLGPMLVAYGALEQSQLESDPISQPPTHEATLESELIEFRLCQPAQIAEARNEQLSERLGFLFGIPSGTQYAFYNGFDLLQAIWGDVPGTVSPLGALTRGLREHPEEAAMDRVLTRLAGNPLHMHEEADMAAFELSDEELAVALAIRSGAASLPDLVEAGHNPDVIRRVVYQLLITRCIAPLVVAPVSTPSSETSAVRRKGRPTEPPGSSSRHGKA